MNSWTYVFHGSLQLVAWVYILPTSVWIIKQKRWVDIHRIANITALSIVILGVVPMIYSNMTIENIYSYTPNSSSSLSSTSLLFSSSSPSSSNRIFLSHKIMGWLLVVVLCINIFIGVFRPALNHPSRWIWRMFHQVFGTLSLLLTPFQIISGIFSDGIGAESIMFLFAIVIPLIIILYVVTYYYCFRVAKSNENILTSSQMKVDEGTWLRRVAVQEAVGETLL